MPKLLILALVLAVVPALADWIKIKEWSGSGSKETESFQMESAEWRINWRSAGGGLLSVEVYHDVGKMVSLVANTREAGSDTSYVHKRGRFYLKINAVNTRWSVSVEDNR